MRARGIYYYYYYYCAGVGDLCATIITYNLAVINSLRCCCRCCCCPLLYIYTCCNTYDYTTTNREQPINPCAHIFLPTRDRFILLLLLGRSIILRRLIERYIYIYMYLYIGGNEGVKGHHHRAHNITYRQEFDLRQRRCEYNKKDNAPCNSIASVGTRRIYIYIYMRIHLYSFIYVCVLCYRVVTRLETLLSTVVCIIIILNSKTNFDGLDANHRTEIAVMKEAESAKEVGFY